MPQAKTIEIRAYREGFRRCGIAHSEAPTWYGEKAFSQAQWAVLRAEPMLKVTPVSPVADDDTEAEPESAELEAESEEDRARRILSATRVPQLKKELTRMGVDIPARANKADLVALILASTAPVEGTDLKSVPDEEA